MTKRVRWSTVTIHEFGVGHGGSAVPHTGPSIGLAAIPEFTWSTRVGAMARECDGVRRFTSQERIALLRNAGYSSDCVDAFVLEAKRVRRSRVLYNSAEMKQMREQRKQRKRDREGDSTTNTKTTRARIATSEGKALQDASQNAPTLRIDVANTSKATTTVTPLVPPALPLSPVCS